MVYSYGDCETARWNNLDLLELKGNKLFVRNLDSNGQDIIPITIFEQELVMVPVEIPFETLPVEEQRVIRQEEACLKNKGEDCYNLAVNYLWGTTLEQDSKEGMNLLEKSCNLDFYHACGTLGYIYRRGEFKIKKDFKKSMTFYSKGIKGKDRLSYSGMGHLYDNGHYVEKNVSKAIEFYSHACEKDDFTSCYNLGIIFTDDEKFRDKKKAEKVLKKSCDLGYGWGCSKLHFSRFMNKLESIYDSIFGN